MPTNALAIWGLPEYRWSQNPTTEQCRSAFKAKEPHLCKGKKGINKLTSAMGCIWMSEVKPEPLGRAVPSLGV